MAQVMRITLKTYDHKLVDRQLRKLLKLQRRQKQKLVVQLPLPTKKEVVTILRAVHKYKDSRAVWTENSGDSSISLLQTRRQ